MVFMRILQNMVNMYVHILQHVVVLGTPGWYEQSSCVRECTVGVDVGDGTTTPLISIRLNIAMGCIVLGRQINVNVSIVACMNTIPLVRMNVRCCTMKIHDSLINCIQTIPSIVLHLAIVQSCS